jgi:Raf kinase inhibitor-like YbhB/YbcL family protein
MLGTSKPGLRSSAAVAVLLWIGLAVPACTSDDPATPGTGGGGGNVTTSAGGTAGSTGGVGGSSGVGGAAGSQAASGGASGSGGSQTGSGGSAGSQAGSGGAAGSAGATADASAAGSGGQAGTSIEAGSSDSSTAVSDGSASDANVKGDATTSEASLSDSGGGGSFALRSTAYTDGMTIPAAHTCAGANTLPPLTWSGGPPSAKSYALSLTDRTNNLVHWVLWDMPATTMSLPAALPNNMPTGSQQSSIGTMGAFSGPCPNGTEHTYVFELYPLDVDKLPNVTASTSRNDLVAAIKSHQLVAPATLTGTSNARRAN